MRNLFVLSALLALTVMMALPAFAHGKATGADLKCPIVICGDHATGPAVTGSPPVFAALHYATITSVAHVVLQQNLTVNAAMPARNTATAWFILTSSANQGPTASVMYSSGVTALRDFDGSAILAHAVNQAITTGRGGSNDNVRMVKAIC